LLGLNNGRISIRWWFQSLPYTEKVTEFWHCALPCDAIEIILPGKFSHHLSRCLSSLWSVAISSVNSPKVSSWFRSCLSMWNSSHKHGYLFSFDRSGHSYQNFYANGTDQIWNIKVIIFGRRNLFCRCHSKTDKHRLSLLKSCVSIPLGSWS
jgi:hypothetical protein